MTTSNANFGAANSNEIEDLANDVHEVLLGKEPGSAPRFEALRRRIRSRLAIARDLAAEKGKRVGRKARDTAGTANAYAHDEPWQVAGAALAAGILLGLVLGRR